MLRDSAAAPPPSPTWTAEDLVRILDHTPAMIAYWSRENRNLFANQAYVEWFGVSPAELHGMHIKELLGPRVYAMNQPYIEGVLAGRQQHFERTLTDAHGEKRYTQASYTPHIVNGEVLGFFVLVADISARVRAEAALRESIQQIALMQERQRIAADLHDLVIQRLYAVSLELEAAERLVSPDDVVRIDSAIEGISDAIQELRASIHSLNRDLEPAALAPAMDRLIRHATRTLGFAPTLTCAGSLDEVPRTVRTELLAVLQEALSNVARHAAATRVDIDMTVQPDLVALRVVDDGRGMHGVTRRSGLANLRARAERLGGTFSCAANIPTGTVLDWRVPVAHPVPRPSA